MLDSVFRMLRQTLTELFYGGKPYRLTSRNAYRGSPEVGRG